jgi:hypothetical protein
MMNSVFYQLQAHWFGVGRSPGTLATKTLVDQFLYTPFLSNPMQTFGSFSSGFLGHSGAYLSGSDLQWPKRWVVSTV